MVHLRWSGGHNLPESLQSRVTLLDLQIMVGIHIDDVLQLTPSTDLITIIGLVAIVLLIGLSAFFSSSEIALFSLPRHRIDTLVAENTHGAEMVQSLKENPHRLLVTILVGNNIANIATSSIATGLLAFYFSPGQSVLFATFGVTSLVLLFGESAPKSYAVEHTESWALTVARPLKLSEYLLLPLVVLFDFLTRQVNRITGGQAALEEQFITREELEEMIDVGEREGALEDTEHELFQRLFRFNSLIAKDAMTPRPDITAVRVDSSITDALSTCVDSQHDRLPLYSENLDNVLGIVDIRDLVESSQRAQTGESRPKSIEECMHPTMHIPESKGLDELLVDMLDSRIELAVVVDEFGTTEGIITLEDITEEIVGEILEQTETRPIQTLDNETAMIRGDVNLDVVNETLDLSLPTGEGYQTISGFIFDRAGRPLDEGEEIRYENVTLRVDRIDGLRIKQITLIQHGSQV
jgi:putative hemolysin